MAGSPILHIKDSYYFEIPKFMARSQCRDKSEFPWAWVKNDSQFQDWAAHRIYSELRSLGQFKDLPAESELLSEYQNWRDHDHANFGKPFDAFLESKKEWFSERLKDESFQKQFHEIKERASGKSSFDEFKNDPTVRWSDEKIDQYNHHLSGKILIPQPFGELRNFYEKESGFCISRFMIVEVAVFLILVFVFSRVARRIATGDAPQGRWWNLMETFLLFVRDEIARKAIHDDHGHGDHGHGGHGEAADGAHHAKHGDHGQSASVITVRPHAADRFVPILWTFFFFILGCNLMGMIPWIGAPTGAWSVTVALAAGTILCSTVFGMLKFGVIGFWLNQIPGMDLPLYLAVFLKPMILVIEIVGYLIKHLVLAIRLLANMVAGHVVLLAIMTLAFSIEGAMSSYWPLTAVISILASTAFSFLELFVAFLQAYVFTFLSALFIGAATSRH